MAKLSQKNKDKKFYSGSENMTEKSFTPKNPINKPFFQSPEMAELTAKLEQRDKEIQKLKQKVGELSQENKTMSEAFERIATSLNIAFESGKRFLPDETVKTFNNSDIAQRAAHIVGLTTIMSSNLADLSKYVIKLTKDNDVEYALENKSDLSINSLTLLTIDLIKESFKNKKYAVAVKNTVFGRKGLPFIRKDSKNNTNAENENSNTADESSKNDNDISLNDDSGEKTSFQDFTNNNILEKLFDFLPNDDEKSETIKSSLIELIKSLRDINDNNNKAKVSRKSSNSNSSDAKTNESNSNTKAKKHIIMLSTEEVIEKLERLKHVLPETYKRIMDLLDGECPACGCKHSLKITKASVIKFVDTAEEITNVQGVLTKAVKNLDKILNLMLTVECSECNFTVDLSSDSGSEPVCPGDSAGSTFMSINAAILQSLGFPVRRLNALNVYLGSGHLTPYEHIKKVAYYLEVIQRAHLLKTLSANNKVTICLDETHSYAYTYDEDNNRSKNPYSWVGIMATPNGFNNENMTCFFTPPSSRASTIQELFKLLGIDTSDPNFTGIAEGLEYFITTDAFATYKRLNDIDGVHHQCCLTHMRRLIYEALENMYGSKKFISANGDTLAEKLINATVEASAANSEDEPLDFTNMETKILCVHLLAKLIDSLFIYENEEFVDQYKRENKISAEKARKSIRYRYSQPIMALFNMIMEGLSKVYAVPPSGSKKAFRRVSDENVSKFVVYYMNHRQEFNVFLDEENICIHSNSAEIIAKAFASIRNINTRTYNPDNAKAYTINFNFREICRLKGITNIVEYYTTIINELRFYMIINFEAVRCHVTNSLDAEGKIIYSKLEDVMITYFGKKVPILETGMFKYIEKVLEERRNKPGFKYSGRIARISLSDEAIFACLEVDDHLLPDNYQQYRAELAKRARTIKKSPRRNYDGIIAIKTRVKPQD